jgi:Mg2+/citrate symporter
MNVPIYELAGFTGAAIIVVAYFAVTQGWLNALDWRFPAANVAGSLLILVSLWFEWNFPSVVIEIFWALISLVGLVRSLAERRRRNLIAARGRSEREGAERSQAQKAQAQKAS